jgi:diguanylate cyclase (GGDEF)-like protein
VGKGFLSGLRRLVLPRHERWPSRFSANEYARQRRLGFPLLQFLPALETEYRDHAMAANVVQLRVTLGFAFFAILGFIAVDSRAGMQLQSPTVVAVLLLVSCPALLIPGLLTLRPGMKPMMYSMLLWGCLLVGLSIVAVILIGKASNPWFPYESLLLVTFYIYGIGLRLPQALLCGGILMFSFVGLGLWLELESPGVMVYSFYYLAISNGLGAIIRYIHEYQDRLSFLLQRELSLHAQQDALTGLLNRRAFRRSAAVIWAQAAREDKPIGLMLLDLDDFKKLNDACGHLAGDEALITASRLLRGHMRRPLDACGRFGGDELVGIWYDAEPAWVRETLSNLMKELEQARVGNQGLRASIGAITVRPMPGCTRSSAKAAGAWPASPGNPTAPRPRPVPSCRGTLRRALPAATAHCAIRFQMFLFIYYKKYK